MCWTRRIFWMWEGWQRPSCSRRGVVRKLWLKVRVTRKMTHARSDEERQRRFLVRVATSVSSLLSLHFHIPLDPSLSHHFPFSPTVTRQILVLLAEGTDIQGLADRFGQK